MITNLCVAIYTMGLFLWEYIVFLCGREKNVCLCNMLHKLAKVNVLYIKVLQSLSTQEKLLTHEQLRTISHYTNNAPYRDDDIDTDFINYLGDNDSRIVLSNNARPIKSGTIALVYKGTMDNKEVVIKVAKKDIYNKIYNGLEQLKYIVRFIMLFNYSLSIDVDEFLQEHREIFLQQVDFQKEIENLKQTKSNFKHVDTVVVPDVYENYTERYSNMIVMDYIDGIELSELQEEDKQQYVPIIIKYFLKSFIYDRFYHADFHPGNILFIKNNGYKIGLIDFGIMNTFNEDEQEAIMHFVKTMCGDSDYSASLTVSMKNLVVPKERYQTLDSLHKTYIIEKNAYIIKNCFDNGDILTPKELQDMNSILHLYDLKVDSSLCKFILALAVLDSVVYKLRSGELYIDLLKKHGSDLFSTSLFEM